MKDRVLNWLATGERGISSCAIAQHMSGLPVLAWAFGPQSFQGIDTPHDPDDLRRCMLLLDVFPEWRHDIVRMSSASPAWASLSAHWSELEELLQHERRTTPPRAPRTYARMKELLAGRTSWVEIKLPIRGAT